MFANMYRKVAQKEFQLTGYFEFLDQKDEKWVFFLLVKRLFRGFSFREGKV